MMSPLYVAINSDQTKSVELLLRKGYSPDAQDCSNTHGLLSPLSLALYRTPQKPYSESVKLLIAAGARLKEQHWIYALATDEADLLQLIFEHRWIPRPEAAAAQGEIEMPDDLAATPGPSWAEVDPQPIATAFCSVWL
ncbi:hypothetical protein ACER0C_029869 [Sarotherodon galilaeus]